MKITKKKIRQKAMYLANKFNISMNKEKITEKINGKPIDFVRKNYLIGNSKNKVSHKKLYLAILPLFDISETEEENDSYINDLRRIND